ncbi:hypothetical protein GC170_20315 [bacterium]|nr:hypothetical protein [bacterium]
MNRRSFQRLSLAAFASSLAPSVSRSMAQAPDAAKLAAWIDKPLLDKDISIDEVRRYVAAKIPRMPALKTPEEWAKWATEHRQKVLDTVIYRGEAAKWRDAKGLKFERMGTVTTDGYLLTKVRYEALPGHWIPALLYEPAGLSADKKVPVHLAVNGHDANGYTADYKQARCIHLAKKGIVSLSLEWYGMGQFKTPDYLHPLINTIDLTGTSGIATHFLAMKRGIDVLLGHPNAEPSKVAVSGLSGGGWQTIFISSLDPRVTLANPVAGYSSFITRTQHDQDLGDSEQTPTDLGSVTDYAIMTALRAPNATLLTFNAKDNCCFRAEHALPPLVAAAKPVYDLMKVPDKLGTHVNETPGDHNFLEDNRKALYKFIGTHFMGLKDAALEAFSKEDVAPSDIKKPEELKVALPADQLSLHGLAMNLAKNLPAAVEMPKDKNAAEIWILEGRKKLREALKLPEAPAPLYDTFTPIGDRTVENGLVRQANLVRVADTWSVPFVEIFPQKSSPKTTSFYLADKGAAEFSADAAARLGAGERVVVCNPFDFGELKPSHHGYLFSLLLGTVGDRPLGIEARQLAAALAMDRSRLGQSIRLVAKGKRAALVALCAAAISNEGTVSEVVLEGSLGSLKEVIEDKTSYTDAPQLFTFGLLQNFDINRIAMLIAPAKLTFKAPSDRAKTELAGLADWWKLLGVDHKPLG